MLGQASIPTHTVLHDADKDSLLASLLLMLLPPLQQLGPLQPLLLLMLLLHDAARASSVR